jgi:hypothetical protein
MSTSRHIDASDFIEPRGERLSGSPSLVLRKVRKYYFLDVCNRIPPPLWVVHFVPSFSMIRVSTRLPLLEASNTT